MKKKIKILYNVALLENHWLYFADPWQLYIQMETYKNRLKNETRIM